jgi:hypothetical protein
MFFPALLAKFLSAGAVAQAASGVGIALVAFTGAGATGILGDDVQTTLTSVVGATDDSAGQVDTQDDSLTADETDTETVESPAVETPVVESPAPTEAEFDAAAWAADGPAPGQPFGQWVREAARAGQADSAVIVKWAHAKHVDLSEVEGVEGIEDTTTATATPTAAVETESADSGKTSHGSGQHNSGKSGGGNSGRGHN